MHITSQQSIHDLQPLFAQQMIENVSQHLLTLSSPLPSSLEDLRYSISNICFYKSSTPPMEQLEQLVRDNWIRIENVPIQQQPRQQINGKMCRICKQVIEYNREKCIDTNLNSIRNEMNCMISNMKTTRDNIRRLAYLSIIHALCLNINTMPNKRSLLLYWMKQYCQFYISVDQDSVIYCLCMQGKISITSNNRILYQWIHAPDMILDYNEFHKNDTVETVFNNSSRRRKRCIENSGVLASEEEVRYKRRKCIS
jgi:hypothetical protein